MADALRLRPPSSFCLMDLGGVNGGVTSDDDPALRAGEGEGGVPGRGRKGDRGGRGGLVELAEGRAGGAGAARGVSKALTRQGSKALMEALEEIGEKGGVLGALRGEKQRLPKPGDWNALEEGDELGGERAEVEVKEEVE